MKNFHKLFCFLPFLVFCNYTLKAQEITLDGLWAFAEDKDNLGVDEEWYKSKLANEIILPGSMAENLKGEEVGMHTKWTANIYDSSWFFNPRMAKFRTPDNFKVPFWLTPVKHYVGVAWYQKEVVIPKKWQKKRVVLFLERPHIETRVWLNDEEIGMQNSLSAPHTFDLTDKLGTGKNTITIRVDNSINEEVNVGLNSHSISDHTQGNWNGIIGKMALMVSERTYIENVQVYPNLQAKSVRVKVLINHPYNEQNVKITLSAGSFNTLKVHQVEKESHQAKLSKGLHQYTFELDMGKDVLLWDEFDPSLYLLNLKMEGKNGLKEERDVQFGMREIKIEGRKFLVNGRHTFLRGTLNNCEFPLTGYPSTKVDDWEHIYKIMKGYGLNHVRFHSWCPPEAAFIAADKVGIYLQPEAPTWPNHSTSLGNGRAIDQYIYDETERMVKVYGNYASFVMLAAGNEPRGGAQAKYLAEFVKHWQNKDKRRVYTGASVAMSWPLVPENEFMVKSGPRGLSWSNERPESHSDYYSKIESFDVPYVTHEMGQWVAFPNFKEIDKYKGVYRARNFEVFKEDLEERGMGSLAEDFLMASGKLQALCYKAEIEKSFRTPDLAGFQLLGLQDFPGQGTALVGLIDVFYEDKGYITSQEASRFCGPTVPLSRLEKFTFTNNEVFKADIELYHFGPTNLKVPVLWRITDDEGASLWEGQFAAKTYPIGNNLQVGHIEFPLSKIEGAKRLKLEVKLEGTSYANEWCFWVYPEKLEKPGPDDIYYTTEIDPKAENVLKEGGKVFLNLAGKVEKGKEVVMYFTPVFWNTSWFKMRPPHVTGSLINSGHPAFEHFPTEYFTDYQWWEIVNRSQVMNLEDFPKSFRPIVQPIDTWFMNRKLGLIFEVKVGNGKLLVTSSDLNPSLDKDKPAARQLYHSIQKYMRSEKFQPTDEVDISIIKDIFKVPSREVWNSYTLDSPDELKPNHIK